MGWQPSTRISPPLVPPPQLKYSTEPTDRVTRACSSVDLEGILARRPELPQNVTVWEEVVADHQLIVDWHEQQWASLGEAVDEW